MRQHIESKHTTAGEPLLIPILLPPKTAFLISPLDMGAIGAFKAHFSKLDRSNLERKKEAAQQAWDQVSNDTLGNIFQNCGITGSEPLEAIRQRFCACVIGVVPGHASTQAQHATSSTNGEEQDSFSRGC